MLSIVLTILFFGFTITVHELGHFVAAKSAGIRVQEFSIGMGPSLLHWGKGETKYSLRLLPIGGYVAMEGENDRSDDPRSFSKKPVWRRIIVILAGATMNLLTGFVLMGIVVACQGQVATTTIAQLADDSPADSPLRAGDTITAVNGGGFLCAKDMQFDLSRLPANEPINLTIVRDGQTLQLHDVGFMRTTESGTTRVLGVTLQAEPVSLANLVPQTVGNALFYGKLVWASLGDLFTGQVSWTQMSGPVGVAQAVGQSAQYGALSVLSLFSFLSINVGLFNLLPFPALDGGQFVFLLIELIFRRPVKKEIQQAINGVGLVLVLGLVAVITFKDIFMLL